MPRAFSEEEKKKIRARLLEVGGQRFASLGLQKTSVEELAQAAGISKGAFYGFFESKEALFMAVMEVVEERFRQELFEKLKEPGPSPRARLVALLTFAFHRWKELPALQFFAYQEYNQVMNRIPAAIFEEHKQADDQFMAELIERCQAVGISIRISPSELLALSYALVLTSFHESDPLPLIGSGTLDLMIELVAAYSLGEVHLEGQFVDEAR
jgi:AcrR family transcriptional regulator